MTFLCGCYYYIHSVDYYARLQKHYLPLVDSSAHSTILSTTSRTVLRQTFTNPSDSSPIKECIYTFPLYDGVSVVNFTCRVGKKVLLGVVKEKFKAKQIFDAAVAKGETAGLLEQAPESSDVFSTKLGNIAAGESVIVEITYIGELKHHDTDGIRFTIPTSIAPRYGAAPTSLHSDVRVNAGKGIKITVDVNMPDGSFIKGVQSPSHPIAVSMGTISTAVNADPTMSKASATLSLGSAALEKDFVLIVQSKDVGVPKALLETHPTIPHHRALMATLVPKFSLPPARPEIVFVADRSGSMQGNIPMLVSAMNVFLKSIPVGVKFNICSFGSRHSFLWPKSKAYTAETLAEATNHLTTFDSNFGGTETFAAVKGTIDRRYTDIPLEIILLTDGDIWSQDTFFQYVNEQVIATKGQIRIFPLGIGSGVSHALIEGLARAGNGFASAVQDGERLDNSVVRMLRGALSPHITDYTLEVKYEQGDDDFEVIEKVTEGLSVLVVEDSPSQDEKTKPTISLFDTAVDPEKEPIKSNDSPYSHLPKVATPKILQAPHQIPTLFAFSRTSVYLLLSPETNRRNPTSVILRATSTHGPLVLEIPVEVLPKPGKTIHQLAAKKAVQDLEEGRGWIQNAKDQQGKLLKETYPSSFQEMVEREAVRLGEKFQIAGKWTSFIAVEANEKVIAANVARQQEVARANRDSSKLGEQTSIPDAFGSESLSFDEGADVLQEFDFDSFLHNDEGGNEFSFDTLAVESNRYVNVLNEVDYEEEDEVAIEDENQEMTAMDIEVMEGIRKRYSILKSEPQCKRMKIAKKCDRNTSPSQPIVQNVNFQATTFDPTIESQPEARRDRASMASPFKASASTGRMFQSSLAGNAVPPPPPGSGSTRGFGAAFTTVKERGASQDGVKSSGLFAKGATPPASNDASRKRSSNPFAPVAFASRVSSVFGSNSQGAPAALQAQQTGTPSGLFSVMPSAPAPSARGGLFGGPSTTQLPPNIGTGPQNLFGGIQASKQSAVPPVLRPQNPSRDLFGGTQASKQSAVPPVSRPQNPSRAAPPAPRGFFRSSGGESPRAQYSRNSPTAPAPRVDWKSKTPAERMLQIISLQDFEGSWTRSDELVAVLGFDIDTDVETEKGSIDPKVWVTLVVLKFLEVQLAEEQGTWGLIDEKARDWVQSLGVVDLDEVEKKAEAFVRSAV